MDKVLHDGTTTELEMLTPRHEAEEVLAAMREPNVAVVRVRQIRLPKGYKLKRKRTKEARRRNRRG